MPSHPTAGSLRPDHFREQPQGLLVCLAVCFLLPKDKLLSYALLIWPFFPPTLKWVKVLPNSRWLAGVHLEHHHRPSGAAGGVAATVGCGVPLRLTPTGVCPHLPAKLGCSPPSPPCLLHEPRVATANWIWGRVVTPTQNRSLAQTIWSP